MEFIYDFIVTPILYHAEHMAISDVLFWKLLHSNGGQKPFNHIDAIGRHTHNILLAFLVECISDAMLEDDYIDTILSSIFPKLTTQT